MLSTGTPVRIKIMGYRQTSYIRGTLIGNKIVGHPDIAERRYRRCSNYIFILDLAPGFNGLGKDNCKTRREAVRFWDLVRCILYVWRYAKSGVMSE